MRSGTVHADFHRHVELVDFVDLAIGLETIGNDLKSDGVAKGNHVDSGFAILAGFELESSLILIALNGVKDDMSIRNGLAIVGADDGDLNCRGRRRGFVFASVVGVVVLSVKRQGTGDQAK